MLPASYIRAYPAKVFPALWHFSHDQTDVIFSVCKRRNNNAACFDFTGDCRGMGLSVEAGLLGPLGGKVGDLWATFSILASAPR